MSTTIYLRPSSTSCIGGSQVKLLKEQTKLEMQISTRKGITTEFSRADGQTIVRRQCPLVHPPPVMILDLPRIPDFLFSVYVLKRLELNLGQRSTYLSGLETWGILYSISMLGKRLTRAPGEQLNSRRPERLSAGTQGGGNGTILLLQL